MFRFWNQLLKRAAAPRLPADFDWEAFCDSRPALFGRLSRDQRSLLAARTAEFINSKLWEGCGGHVLATAHQIRIAADASLLTLGWANSPLVFGQSVLIYPQAFVARQTRQLPGGVLEEAAEARFGEAWQRGPVVLAWDEVLRSGTGDDGSGVDADHAAPRRNVVVHEFAHVLDMQSGAIDGIPDLPSSVGRDEWRSVFEDAHRQLLRESRFGRANVIDPYGLENPAEFWATTCEAFFESGGRLRDHYPPLYALMAKYFQQETAKRE